MHQTGDGASHPCSGQGHSVRTTFVGAFNCQLYFEGFCSEDLEVESDLVNLLCEVHILDFLKISNDQAFVNLMNSVNQDFLIGTKLNLTAGSLWRGHALSIFCCHSNEAHQIKSVHLLQMLYGISKMNSVRRAECYF